MQRYPHLAAITPPGQLVDVDSFRLHQYTLGEGSPTVLLEAAERGWSLDWRHIQPEVAQFTRVCAYDRAGLGWSDPSAQPRHAQQMVDELQVLLERSDIFGPFVLVAASFGGHIARLFTHYFPAEVVGTVLIDARHEDLNDRMPPAWGKLEKRLAANDHRLHAIARIGLLKTIGKALGKRAAPAYIQDLPAHVKAMYLESQYFAAVLAEQEAIAESNALVKAAGSFGDMPLTVIRHGIPDIFSKLPAEQAEQAEEIWRELQAEIAALSTNSQMVVAEQSGHNIPLEQPEVVIAATRELVNRARS